MARSEGCICSNEKYLLYCFGCEEASHSNSSVMVDQYMWHRGSQFDESALSQGMTFTCLTSCVSFA